MILVMLLIEVHGFGVGVGTRMVAARPAHSCGDRHRLQVSRVHRDRGPAASRLGF